MPNFTVYLPPGGAARLQEIARQLGIIAQSGPFAPTHQGSASMLIKHIASGDVMCVLTEEWRRVMDAASPIVDIEGQIAAGEELRESMDAAMQKLQAASEPPMCDYCHTKHYGYQDHYGA